MIRKTFISAAFLFASLVSFLSPQAFADDDLMAAIQGREDAFAAAFNANDAAGVASLYTMDAKLIAPGGEPIVGREAIEAVLPGFFAVLKNLKLTTDSVTMMSDTFAVEVGHTEYDALGEDGSLTPGSDNYVVVWQKGEDGVWYFHTDIFNSK